MEKKDVNRELYRGQIGQVLNRLKSKGKISAEIAEEIYVAHCGTLTTMMEEAKRQFVKMMNPEGKVQ